MKKPGLSSARLAVSLTFGFAAACAMIDCGFPMFETMIGDSVYGTSSYKIHKTLSAIGETIFLLGRDEYDRNLLEISEDPEINLRNARELRESHPNDKVFIARYLNLLYQRNYWNSPNSPEWKSLECALLAAAALDPDNAYYDYLLANLYLNASHTVQSKKTSFEDMALERMLSGARKAHLNTCSRDFAVKRLKALGDTNTYSKYLRSLAYVMAITHHLYGSPDRDFVEFAFDRAESARKQGKSRMARELSRFWKRLVAQVESAAVDSFDYMEILLVAKTAENRLKKIIESDSGSKLRNDEKEAAELTAKYAALSNRQDSDIRKILKTKPGFIGTLTVYCSYSLHGAFPGNAKSAHRAFRELEYIIALKTLFSGLAFFFILLVAPALSLALFAVARKPAADETLTTKQGIWKPLAAAALCVIAPTILCLLLFFNTSSAIEFILDAPWRTILLFAAAFCSTVVSSVYTAIKLTGSPSGIWNKSLHTSWIYFVGFALLGTFVGLAAMSFIPTQLLDADISIRSWMLISGIAGILSLIFILASLEGGMWLWRSVKKSLKEHGNGLGRIAITNAVTLSCAILALLLALSLSVGYCERKLLRGKPFLHLSEH